jgi:hypothetical protein
MRRFENRQNYKRSFNKNRMGDVKEEIRTRPENWEVYKQSLQNMSNT